MQQQHLRQQQQQHQQQQHQKPYAFATLFLSCGDGWNGSPRLRVPAKPTLVVICLGPRQKLQQQQQQQQEHQRWQLQHSGQQQHTEKNP
ncbi:GD13860 [Drosophila simulans]|uniref:GD13860 n=1 Tax=Drosophila simulans TaxID=7240 RepID=B4QR20_DROSI|nr:GD13860 [Drosophila simulans]